MKLKRLAAILTVPLILGAPASAAPARLCDRIFFISSTGQGPQQLASIRPSGNGRKVTAELANYAYRSAVSPDGRWIATSVWVGEKEGSNLLLLSSDGSQNIELTEGPARDTRPSWSPDSERLVFERSEGTGPGTIRIIDIRTKAEEELTSGTAPHWSPVDDRIVFTGASSQPVDLTTDLRLIDADGSNEVIITNDSLSHDDAPVWSPDGRRIAFLRYPVDQQNENEGPYADIWRVRRDGNRLFQITHQQDDLNGVHAPVWSPNGRRIAYVFANDGGSWIHKVRSDGEHHVRVTRGWSARAFDPSWSPGGKRLVYVKAGDVGSDLWKAKPNGERKRAVTQSPEHHETSAEWVRCSD